MIDLHCHILPGLDDGAKDLQESIAMSFIASKDGIRTILATPHTLNGIFVNDCKTIYLKVKELQEALIHKNIDIKIVAGADVHVDYAIMDLINEGKALTINDQRRYILLEFPHQLVPPNMPDYIFMLKINGITPIITHPERNAVIQNDLSIIQRLVEQGALIQITSMSLTGHFGSRAYKCSIKMLKLGLAHIIASDAHSSRFRPPILSDAVRHASKIVGQDYAVAMVTSIPQKIIEGETISELPEPVKPKRSFWGSIFKRT